MSKELFFAQREARLATMSKKELANEANEYAMLILEEKEPEEVLAKTLRVEAFAIALNKALKTQISEPLSYGGVDYSESNRTTLNYKEDAIWKELNNKLKAREELLKARVKVGKVIFDDNGEEVPLISSSTTTSIRATIK